MKLPLQFSKEVVEHSDTAIRLGIDNSASAEVLENAEALYTNVLIPLRIRLSIKFGRQIELYINSWFRCPQLNAEVRGSDKSQHLRGMATDTYVVGITFDEYYSAVKELILNKKLPIDQCIKEYGKRPETNDDDWLHLSHNPNGINRGNLLIKEKGKPYIRDV